MMSKTHELERHLSKGATPNQYPPPLVIGVERDPAATAAIVDADAVVQWLLAAAAAAGCTDDAAAAAAVGELQRFCFGRHLQPFPLAVSLHDPCMAHCSINSLSASPLFIARPGSNTAASPADDEPITPSLVTVRPRCHSPVTPSLFVARPTLKAVCSVHLASQKITISYAAGQSA